MGSQCSSIKIKIQKSTCVLVHLLCCQLKNGPYIHSFKRDANIGVWETNEIHQEIRLQNSSRCFAKSNYDKVLKSHSIKTLMGLLV